MHLNLQETMQEDEGATVRIEELEKKLRLAESLADHIYAKYEELAQESHEEHSQLDEVRSKMEDMTSEMQSAFHYIQEQNQTFDAYNRRAQSLNEEHRAIMGVANDLQMRMLELQDENRNMLEEAQREREKQWSNEVRQMQLTDEITESTGHQYQEQRMVEHLRGQLAVVKGSELSTVAEMNARDFEQKTEVYGY